MQPETVSLKAPLQMYSKMKSVTVAFTALYGLGFLTARPCNQKIFSSRAGCSWCAN
jgi:hypothetical protein